MIKKIRGKVMEIMLIMFFKDDGDACVYIGDIDYNHHGSIALIEEEIVTIWC